MNNLLKLIVPLLNDKISYDDISVEAGFVDAYTFDKNRPEMGCIYLMYDASLRNKKVSSRYFKFRSLPELKTSRIIYIQNKSYLLYVFSITTKTIRDLAKGLILLNDNQKTRILQFWSLRDTFVHTVILNNINFLEYMFSVPEEDYASDFFEAMVDKKSQGLLIESLA